MSSSVAIVVFTMPEEQNELATALHLLRDNKLYSSERNQQGVLTFPLPESMNEFDIAVHSMNFALAWEDIKNVLREYLKYGNLPNEQQKILEEFREKLFDIQNNRGLPEVL